MLLVQQQQGVQTFDGSLLGTNGNGAALHDLASQGMALSLANRTVEVNQIELN